MTFIVSIMAFYAHLANFKNYLCEQKMSNVCLAEHVEDVCIRIRAICDFFVV